jgi:hypothetical protein
MSKFLKISGAFPASLRRGSFERACSGEYMIVDILVMLSEAKHLLVAA